MVKKIMGNQQFIKLISEVSPNEDKLIKELERMNINDLPAILNHCAADGQEISNLIYDETAKKMAPWFRQLNKMGVMSEVQIDFFTERISSTGAAKLLRAMEENQIGLQVDRTFVPILRSKLKKRIKKGRA